jgi:hypothetical protein
LVIPSTLVAVGGTWVRADQSVLGSKPSEPMDLKLGTLVTVWTVLDDSASLNWTGMTPRLAGQVEVLSGLMGCWIWDL